MCSSFWLMIGAASGTGASSQPAITFDSLGNGTFSGKLTANEIDAGTIKGMDVYTDRISSLSNQVDSLANAKDVNADTLLVMGTSTFMGLSGIGDLILTAYGTLSRNRAFGEELAAGKKPDEIIGTQRTVVEGYYTIKAAHALAGKSGIEMPITRELYRIVYEGKGLEASLREIKTRVLKEEDE